MSKIFVKKNEDLIVKIVAWLILAAFIGLLFGIGLLVDYIKYKAYISVTHQHMTFWTYHLVKDHLRMIK